MVEMSIVIAVMILVIALICYILNWMIDKDSDKIAGRIIEKRKGVNRPTISIGPEPYSKLYRSEDRELQLPISHFKYLTIYGAPDEYEYTLTWASSIMEQHYSTKLPNSISIPNNRTSMSFLINVVMSPEVQKRFKNERKFEQVFLDIRNSNDILVGSYKLVLYYDYDLYIRNNPIFA